jgi:paraquat-inducible protein A
MPDKAPSFLLSRPIRWWVGLMLTVSLSCNVGVLFTPFMDLRSGFSSEPYSLFRTVNMFWTAGLPALAILVVAFSVVFPFAKLAVLGTVLLGGARPNPWLRSLLHLVERYGKWSMLDVYLVCLILLLTSGQLLVGAVPRLGIPLFVTAILLSMTAGQILAAGLRAKTNEAESAALPHGGWLAVAGIALAATLAWPFLAVHDWRLLDRSYSLITLVPILWREGAVVGSLVSAAFLVTAPVAAWMMYVLVWWRMKRGLSYRLALGWADGLRRWSMLEVFALALAVFVIEGDELMKTEVRWGSALLVGTLVIQRLSGTVATRRPGKVG